MVGDNVYPFRVPDQADATGALEAVKAAVGALPTDRVAPRFLLAAASEISASDVDLAFASEAIILGFNVEPNEAAQAAAKQFGARCMRMFVCLLRSHESP
jgi:translation initiation factor IF-2